MESLLEVFLEEASAALEPVAKSTQLAEAAAIDGAGESSGSSNFAAEHTAGSLLLALCVDWDGMAGKKPYGYDIPHLVRMPAPVQQIFSSSSSSHMFLTLNDGRLFGMGKNIDGQLGLGDNTTRKSFYDISELDVYGCGSNAFGQLGLGDGKKDSMNSLKFRKIPLHSVRDIACGSDFSLSCLTDGSLYSFGHPEYGQLGHGSNGEFIKEGKKGIQYSCISRPKQIRYFVSKDSKGKLEEIPNNSVKVISVAAGKNHSICLEDWVDEGFNLNRVFTWGFGGYGKLGHNSANDEFLPREIKVFSQSQARPFNSQRKIREIYGGSTYSIAISASRHLHFWGKLPNSPRGEATIYPKLQEELYDWSIACVGAGSSFVVVSANAVDVCVGWGVPVAGKLGFHGDVKSSVVPQFVERVRGLKTLSLACGYGHCAFIVDSSAPDAQVVLSQFPAIEGVIDTDETKPASLSGNKRKVSDRK